MGHLTSQEWSWATICGSHGNPAWSKAWLRHAAGGALADGLAVGQAMRVLSGPFADMIGKLARLDGGERVEVLLRLLGGEVPVSVSRQALMPALAA